MTQQDILFHRLATKQIEYYLARLRYWRAIVEHLKANGCTYSDDVRECTDVQRSIRACLDIHVAR